MCDGSEYKFVFDDNLLYRRCTKSDSVKQLGKQALVVSAQCRKVDLSTSHESPLLVTLATVKQTYDFVSIFFPSVREDV